MRHPTLALVLAGLTPLMAASPLPPEAPRVAQAERLYRAETPMPLTGPGDLLKLRQDGDLTLDFLALTSRWVGDTLAHGFLPDEFAPQRLLETFTWDEAGVLQLHAAGLGGRFLQGLARLRPLGLDAAAQTRLASAGVDPGTVAALGAKPGAALPPLKPMAAMGAMGLSPDHPMMQNPAFKAKMAEQMKLIQDKMAAQFRSDSFRKDLWERCLEAWRCRIQVGADAEWPLEPARTELLMGPAGPPSQGPQQGLDAARDANGLLRSTPLAAVLDVASVVSALKAKATVPVRIMDPDGVRTFRFQEAPAFYLRKDPSQLILVRIQDQDGDLLGTFTKGAFFGTDLKPADEPVPVDTVKEDGAWTLRPKAPLAPGPYAFVSGGKNVQVLPFRVQ